MNNIFILKFAIPTLGLLLQAGVVNAGVVMKSGTTGVFASGCNDNAIDRDSTGQLAAFSTRVASAYESGLGGVVDWETGVNPRPSDKTFSNNKFSSVIASLGNSRNRWITLKFDREMELYTNGINGQISVLSRKAGFHNAIIPSGGHAGQEAEGLKFTLSFPDAKIKEFGAVMPSRTTYGDKGVKFQAKANFSGGGSKVIELEIGNVAGGDDSFVYFSAPRGETIATLSFACLDDNGQSLANGQRRPVLDDLGFILGDPPYTIRSSSNFADWIADYPELMGKIAFGDDPDQDGIVNGIEYMMGTHPGEPTHGLVLNSVVNDTVTFSHKLNVSDLRDISASYRWSMDRSNFHKSGESYEGTTVTFERNGRIGDTVNVKATIQGKDPEELYFDIEVIKNSE